MSGSVEEGVSRRECRGGSVEKGIEKNVGKEVEKEELRVTAVLRPAKPQSQITIKVQYRPLTKKRSTERILL